MSEPSIFQKIIDREVDADIVHEDDRCIAFRDINPQAPTHILIVPKRPIPSLDDVEDEDADLLGHLHLVARDLAREEGLRDGYRTVINTGDDGGQTVYHLHMHLLGGRRLDWPPG
jgi:histidine triad (HIT) family protein